MIKEVNIKKMSQVKRLIELATKYSEDIGVHDKAGAIADAKSILGMLALDYTQPVLLVSEDRHILEKVYRGVISAAS